MSMPATAGKRRPRAARVSATAAPILTETIQGTVTRVAFQNPENGYTVLRLRPEEKSMFDEITAVGYFVNLRMDDTYRITGTWKEHPRFGRQFLVSEHELVIPTHKKGIAAYLCSVGTGIGPVKAERIVDELGEGCLEKIKEDPAILMTVRGVTKEQAEEIHAALTGDSVLAELTALICREGITPGLAAKIYAVYKGDSVRVVKENPYILAEEIWGIGFIKADKVANAVGIEANDPYRVEAVVQYVLGEAANGDGHCYLLPSEIVKEVYSLLGATCGIGVDDLAAAVKRLQEAGKLKREEDWIYREGLYSAEEAVAEKLKTLIRRQIGLEVEVARRLLDDIQSRDGIDYAPQQVEAVLTTLSAPVSIITGGPGTGKTTVVNAVVECWRRLHENGHIYLAAPTGRAAKRMSEATGYEAKTIHRLLEYHPMEGFRVNADCPFYGPGLLVVDEFSMTDVELCNHLLAAVPDNIQVVFVGDVDQLPSVGPGSVLRDCIQSGIIPTVRLRFNYRQAGGSKVAEYAHWIVNGHEPPLQSEGDWNFHMVATPEEAAEKVLAEIGELQAAGMGPMDFQVLCPQKKGSAGVDKLNEQIREMLNPSRPDAPEFCRFRARDKVMVIKNDYERNVFNGDIGIITEVVGKEDDKGPGLYVDFDGNLVHFDHDAVIAKLVLAYTSTIHKSQGSEFPVVIMACTRQSWIMLQRNLLYTGITRAKKKLVLIGQSEAVRRAVENNRIAGRNSRLAERLKG